MGTDRSRKRVLDSRLLGRRAFLEMAGLSAAASLCPAAWSLAGPTAADKPRSKLARGPLYWSWWGWEPMDHYRRLGGNVAAVDTSAPWLTEWFDRLHSEEIVQTMAGLGVNLAVTHFFKGFGLKQEHDEQQRTAELVRHAHRHGIRVLGYCQSRSLYYENFLAEEPGAESWVQRDATGQLRTWGGAYYRWTPCIMSGEFRAYMKRAIRVGLEEIGLDGLHFDNSYCEPCYCPRCEAAFRKWLARRYPDPRRYFGMSTFAQVREPPTTTATRITDPLAQAWVRFRCESLADYHRDITQYARTLRPDVLLLANPAYPRGADGPYRRSVWGPWLGRHLDLMFAENGNFPGLDNGAVVSQIRAYKYGTACGYRVVSTTWRRGAESGLGLPDTAEAIALQVTEAAAYGGVPGTNWALRPQGNGNRMRIDQPEMRSALAKYLAFVRGNEKLLADARPVRDVALLHSFGSQAYNWKESGADVQGAEETLIRGGFSWEVVLDDDLAGLQGFAALVLAGQPNLDQATCDAVRKFAAQGGGVVLVGPAGTCDEQGRTRAGGGLDGLAGPRVLRLEQGVSRSTADSAYVGRVPLPKRWKELAAAVRQVAGQQFAVRLEGSTTVAVSAYELPGNRLAVHLVNYATAEPTKPLRLVLGPKWKTARSVDMLTAEKPAEKLKAEQAAIRVPPFAVYALVILG
jgi:hypothetical protein